MKEFYKLKIFNFSSKFTIILAEISALKCEKIQQNIALKKAPFYNF